MAAGKGTRIGAVDKPKVMFEVAGKPIIGWGIQPFLKMKAEGLVDRIIIIVGFHGQQVIDYLGEQSEYVWQTEQLGTAHAVQMAEPLLAGQDGLTIIVNGDHALSSEETFRNILGVFAEQKLDLAMGVVNSAERFPSYGRIVRNAKGEIQGIVEVPEATEEQKLITEKNVNLFVVDNCWLFDELPKIQQSSVKKEYYIVDIVKRAIDSGLKVETVKLANNDEALGINTLEDRAEVEEILKKKEIL
jgi:bifunctional UDP-N-acetylglucosamine pyrophosphorylase/glucosamine-1-phosphate N-acetyltransferase